MQKKDDKGKMLAEAGINPCWMTPYARFDMRCRDDRDLGFVTYLYEQGLYVGNYTGDLFWNRD